MPKVRKPIESNDFDPSKTRPQSRVTALDSILDRLAKLETENAFLKESAKMVQEAYQMMLKRPVVVGFTTEHLDRIVEGLGQYLIEHQQDIKWKN